MGVLTHHFENILNKNILLEIKEWPLKCFFQEQQSEIEEKEAYCWPIFYQNKEELERFLQIERYKYIKISSSYGLWGWILAKKIEIQSDF